MRIYYLHIVQNLRGLADVLSERLIHAHPHALVIRTQPDPSGLAVAIATVSRLENLRTDPVTDL